MKNTVLDLQALKTFMLGIELKSFALAAKQQHKSTSAISAQLKKLEMQTNATLVKKEGRYLLPTEHGERLLSYAKKILALNDEAVEMLKCIGLEGKILVGLQEDFAQGVLTECLGQFARINDKVQLNTMIEKYSKLISATKENTLDLSVTWKGNIDTPYSNTISQENIQWLSSPDFSLDKYIKYDQPLPLVVVEPNCGFKEKAIKALDAQGIKWKVVYQSQSLSGIWPAIAAGIGITARTNIGRPKNLDVISKGLPDLGNIEIQLNKSQAGSNDIMDRLIEIIKVAIKLG